MDPNPAEDLHLLPPRSTPYAFWAHDHVRLRRTMFDMCPICMKLLSGEAVDLNDSLYNNILWLRIVVHVHRSHFGSRYHIWLTRLAGLFAARSIWSPWTHTSALSQPIVGRNPRARTTWRKVSEVFPVRLYSNRITSIVISFVRTRQFRQIPILVMMIDCASSAL